MVLPGDTMYAPTHLSLFAMRAIPRLAILGGAALCLIPCCAGGKTPSPPAAPAAVEQPPAAPVASAPSSAPAPADSEAWLSTPEDSSAPPPDASGPVDIFGQPVGQPRSDDLVYDRVSIEGGRLSRIHLRATGSCEGDCAMHYSTVFSLVMEQNPGAIPACFAAPTRSQSTFRFSLTTRGRVINAQLVNTDGRRADALCVLGVLRNATLPPGSDPAAVLTVHLEAEREVRSR
jgi:hypothetical protein